MKKDIDIIDSNCKDEERDDSNNGKEFEVELKAKCSRICMYVGLAQNKAPNDAHNDSIGHITPTKASQGLLFMISDLREVTTVNPRMTKKVTDIRGSALIPVLRTSSDKSPSEVVCRRIKGSLTLLST